MSLGKQIKPSNSIRTKADFFLKEPVMLMRIRDLVQPGKLDVTEAVGSEQW